MMPSQGWETHAVSPVADIEALVVDAKAAPLGTPSSSGVESLHFNSILHAGGDLLVVRSLASPARASGSLLSAALAKTYRAGVSLWFAALAKTYRVGVSLLFTSLYVSIFQMTPRTGRRFCSYYPSFRASRGVQGGGLLVVRRSARLIFHFSTHQSHDRKTCRPHSKSLRTHREEPSRTVRGLRHQERHESHPSHQACARDPLAVSRAGGQSSGGTRTVRLICVQGGDMVTRCPARSTARLHRFSRISRTPAFSHLPSIFPTFPLATIHYKT